ncbi:hypothetical protein MMC17_009249 [Xylographa soralifera]|nr:hypothetical protein [Xylographa soralifera]
MPPKIISARSGVFACLQAGQQVKITNPSGKQVVDLWAFAAPRGPSVIFGFKFLSMCHTRSSLMKLTLSLDDSLTDNERMPMLSLIEDTSGGAHDLLFAACDKYRYRQLGVEGYHQSCSDNLKAQLKEASLESNKLLSSVLYDAIGQASSTVEHWTPDPLNLFMNVPVKALEHGKGGKLALEAPACPQGGYVVLQAEQECVVIMSACPMDLSSIYNGHEAEFEVLTG